MKKENNPVKETKPILKRVEIRSRITNLFGENPSRALNHKQISHMIGAKTTPAKQLVFEELEEMTRQGSLRALAPGKYRLDNRGIYAEGIFERRSNGKNMVRLLETDETVFVAERNAMRAMNGDKVRILFCAKRKGREAEGEVVEVLEKADQLFVGTLEIQPGYAFLVTDSKILANDIFIPKERLKGGQNGEKALVRIIDWPERAKNPYGEVIDVLGKAGENNTEIHAILAEYGLPYAYPQEVEAAAEKLSGEITPEEISKREDFRKVTTFTIDPLDAKDFDDAISIRSLSKGRWEIGVHIADVTHYVTPDSIIEKEAEERATSIYLVDRVVPMLPERLCNFICSLRPHEEKLCFSAIFEMDEAGNVHQSRIARTVICSDRRFTYEEAQATIETGEGDFASEILTLNGLAQKLRANRFSSGAINFDRHEVKFEIDETGRPLRVYFKISKEANKLVEEFMLLANRTVAEWVGKVHGNRKPKTFVYRVHDLPDPDKLNTFAEFIRRFGYKLKSEGSKGEISRSINTLLENVQGKREENLIETVAIRAMAKAAYSTENIGHYGLAFDYYTHFTSPIRRYPDMMVHRLLALYMAGGKSAEEGLYAARCKHSSDREQLAANAERASIKYKQAEFLSERLGEIYDGVISGVTEWGIYVEINENKCEGMVPIRDFEDDYYEFDEKNYCIVGRRKHKVYRLGDPIRIQVARTNMERKTIDFALVE